MSDYIIELSAPATVVQNSYPTSVLGTATFTPTITLGTGTDFGLSSFEGVLGLPDVRTDDTVRPLRHGMRAGADLLGGRTMQFSFIVKAASREALGAKLAVARAALTVSSTLRQCIINFPEMDGPHWTQVRVRKFDIQRDPKASTATINLELFAPDPLLYENTINEQTVYANLANLVGNTRTYPRVYPLSYTTGVLPFASVASSYASLQNNGSVASDWEAEIVGPCETPVFTNLDTGQILAFNGSVPAGSTLRVSSRERTVFLDNASRYSWLASGSSWWLLEPGATRVRFTAHAQSGSAVLRFRSTSD